MESDGELVERDALMRAVWPGRVVDENSIGRAVSSLRAALKEHGAPDSLIVTVPGRGYRFGAIASVEPRDAAPVLADTGPPVAPDPTDIQAPSRPVRRWAALLVLATVVAASLAWRTLQPPAAPTPGSSQAHGPAHDPRAPSVAVLPFANLSGDPSEDILADGITDELINALGRIGNLRVAARRSSFLFKTRQADIADIATKLNVGAVLEGSIRRDATRVRITTQLIDPATGYQIWSHSYDRSEGDLLTLEAEIAGEVISSLRIVLLPQDAARLTLGGTSNPAAFDAYLIGLSRSLASDFAIRKTAEGYFTKAIALDPNYATAYVERAISRAGVGAGGPSTDVEASRRLIADGVHDAEHAIELAPDLGEAHLALGFALRQTVSDFARAEAECSRGIELVPGNARMLRMYSWCELVVGHSSAAINAAQHAVELDPLTPASYHTLARVFANTGRYEDAEAALRRAELLPAGDASADRAARVFVATYKGDPTAEVSICAGHQDTISLVCLALAYHTLARQPDAEAALAKLQSIYGDNGAIQYAEIYAAWGRQQDALHWLEAAYRLRDAGLADMRFDPLLKPLRATPEYLAIEQALHFPP